MLSLILPSGIESEEAFGDLPDGVLFPEEARIIAHAVEGRQREYAAVRSCARACLERLGLPQVPILQGLEGAPAWPVGVRGSMTHCAGYAAAAVGRVDQVSAVGIDAEPDVPLPDGVLSFVATQVEQARLAKIPAVAGGPCWDRLLFSAKEAVYKAWFPLVGEWLDLQEAEIFFDPLDRTFTAVLSREGLVIDGQPVDRLQGSWVRAQGILLTSVVLPRSPSR